MAYNVFLCHGINWDRFWHLEDCDSYCSFLHLYVRFSFTIQSVDQAPCSGEMAFRMYFAMDLMFLVHDVDMTREQSCTIGNQDVAGEARKGQHNKN